mmetsp:Transcript_23344/g.45359  ORF Transcript_23344/g.45359 Transcript_23344/m.45359 type:complete len:224 (-) Transcript_23344:1511-2182(-)
MSSPTASALGIALRTTSLPTYRSILPGAPPTYPKSASAISPGPFTMHPMTAIVTPGRWPVLWDISSVTVWRSKRVLPQEGHETYSVLVLRIRDPWRRPNDVVRRKLRSCPSPSMHTPSPSPSTSETPTVEPVRSTISSFTLPSSPNAMWWMMGVMISDSFMKLKTRREACTRDTPAGTLSMMRRGSRVLSFDITSSDSSPRTVIAYRMAPSGRGTESPTEARS